MATTKKQRHDAQVRATYRRLFNTEDGQVVLADLMKRFHIFRGVYDEDIHGMVLMEGERNVVLHIIDTLAITPEAYVEKYTELQREHLTLLEATDG